jgi:hypothetical protein
MVVGGAFGGFPLAAALCLPLLFVRDEVFKIETLFVFFIFIYFLGDNYKGVLSFAQNLRFVILGIGLLVLLRFQLFTSNEAKYILPFAIVATVITFWLSPLGLEATSRGLSYFLVALVVFKCVQLLLEHDAQRFFNLLIIMLLFYFGLNILVFFIPFLGEAYLKGRFMGIMGNPNGLGLVAMFSYGLLDVIRKQKQTSFNALFFKGFKIVLIALVVLSGSRTALFGVLIYEVALRLLKFKVLLAIALIGIGFIYSISATLSIEDIVASLGLSEYLRVESIADGSGRTEVWAVAVEEIKNQPWFGKGMLYDGYFINNFAERFMGENKARAWYGIWNSYLSLLLNVGILGIAAYSFFWYKMYALSQMKIIRFAFLMMCLFSAITESWMAASMNGFTPLVFLCWAIQMQVAKPIIKDL